MSPESIVPHIRNKKIVVGRKTPKRHLKMNTKKYSIRQKIENGHKNEVFFLAFFDKAK